MGPLYYLCTKDGLEVDFAIVANNNVEVVIEVKTSDTDISKSLRYFQRIYALPAVQLVQILRNEFNSYNVKVLDLVKYLSELYL